MTWIFEFFFRKLLRDIHWKGTLSIENRWASQVNLNVRLLLATVRRGLTILRRSVRVTCCFEGSKFGKGLLRIKIFREIPTGDTYRKRTTDNGKRVRLSSTCLSIWVRFRSRRTLFWDGPWELVLLVSNTQQVNVSDERWSSSKLRMHKISWTKAFVKIILFTGLFIKMNWLCDLSQEKHWFRIPSWVTSGACFMYMSV